MPDSFTEACGHGDPCPCKVDLEAVQRSRDAFKQRVWHLTDCLLGCINQYAHVHDQGKAEAKDEILSSGGLSAMEEVFEVLALPQKFSRQTLWDKWEQERRKTA